MLGGMMMVMPGFGLALLVRCLAILVRTYNHDLTMGYVSFIRLGKRMLVFPKPIVVKLFTSIIYELS
jgi:hypothetical protein